MKKSDILESVIILLSAVLLLLIWAASSQAILFSPTLVKILSFLQYPLVVVLSVIFIRRVRRVIRAFRENKNKPGPF